MQLQSELLCLADMSRFARTGPKRPPQRLLNWLRKQGGLRDQFGELSHLTGGRQYRLFGLIDNKRGLDLDTAAHRAWEAGYLQGNERPDINALLDAIAEDLKGFPVYSADDAHRLEEYEAAEAVRHDLDRLGILAADNKTQTRVERALKHYAKQVH